MPRKEEGSTYEDIQHFLGQDSQGNITKEHWQNLANSQDVIQLGHEA
jgi:hypothetical protein